MAIRLRWALHGVRHNRILHLVAINNRKARNAKPKELLGVYNPHVAPLVAPGSGPAVLSDRQTKTMEWSVPRIRYWLSVGARPTKSVARMLERGGILDLESPYGKRKYQANPALLEADRERLRAGKKVKGRCGRCRRAGHEEGDCMVPKKLGTLGMTRADIERAFGKYHVQVYMGDDPDAREEVPQETEEVVSPEQEMHDFWELISEVEDSTELSEDEKSKIMDELFKNDEQEEARPTSEPANEEDDVDDGTLWNKK